MSRKHIFIHLNEQELKDLQEFSTTLARNRKFSTRLRGNALFRSAKQHLTIDQIARSLGRSRRTICRWFKLFREKGISGLYRTYRCKLSPHQVAEMMRVSNWKNADLGRPGGSKWSFVRTACWVREKWGIAISPKRISQIIRVYLFDPLKLMDSDPAYIDIFNNDFGNRRTPAVNKISHK